MPTTEYKLQNVLLENDQRTHDYESMYVRTFSPLLFEDGHMRMPASTQYDFSTYFGSLSVKKWNRYADVDNFALKLDITGKFEVRLSYFVNDMEYNIAERHTISQTRYSLSEEDRPLLVEYPEDIHEIADVVAFEVTAISECSFYGACYVTQIEEGRIRDVELNIVMPTFKKEDFVRRNVKLFEKLMESEEPVAKHLTVSVVDNGRTLGEEPLSDNPAIRKYDNPNYGGAGGFARGMIEALHADNPPTHLMMMDDDVSVSPESFCRTYNLLSIVNDEYSEAFLSGAMLSMQLQDKQVEDVGNIFANGTFGAIKPERNLSDLNHVVSNDTIRFNRQRQYAAFWFCCYPLDVVRRQGLTMPFFVRGDDAEFGLREPGRKFMTMNGICVWHMSFGHSKFNAFNECYLAIRNMLIITSVVDSCRGVNAYQELFVHDLETELRKFNYDYCDMMCDAVDDYLKGPAWLAGADPEKILKTQSAKKPKMSEFTEALPAEAGRLYDDGGELPITDKVKMKLTHNGHVKCKDSDMIDTPGIMLNEFRAYHPVRIFMRKEIWFVNDDMATGYKTHIDRERYSRIVARRDALAKRIQLEGEEVAQAWREAYPTLVSEKFWIAFLGLDPREYR